MIRRRIFCIFAIVLFSSMILFSITGRKVNTRIITYNLYDFFDLRHSNELINVFNNSLIYLKNRKIKIVNLDTNKTKQIKLDCDEVTSYTMYGEKLYILKEQNGSYSLDIVDILNVDAIHFVNFDQDIQFTHKARMAVFDEIIVITDDNIFFTIDSLGNIHSYVITDYFDDVQIFFESQFPSSITFSEYGLFLGFLGGDWSGGLYRFPYKDVNHTGNSGDYFSLNR